MPYTLVGPDGPEVQVIFLNIPSVLVLKNQTMFILGLRYISMDKTGMHREADLLIIRLRRLINQWRMPTRATRESDNCASGLEEAIEDYDVVTLRDLMRDAERYRWLRTRCTDDLCVRKGIAQITGSALNSAIDTAIQGERHER